MNPIISYFIESAGIDTLLDVNQIVCEYEDGKGKVKVSLYPVQEGSNSVSFVKDTKELSTDKFSQIYSVLTSQELSSGVERDKLFDIKTHRLIKSLRFFLPTGKSQIDFEDEPMNIDYSLFIEEYMRNTFKVIH